MLHLNQVVTSGDPPATAKNRPTTTALTPTLTLTFDERRRSRRLVRLDDGREAALRLPRGTILRHGDLLRTAEDGLVVEVCAAAESLSVGRTSDPHLLTRAAYHLGNRHVPLEIGEGWVSYAHDHVLDDLVRALGLAVEPQQAPFEPEAGAFQHEPSGDHRENDAAAPHRHHPDGEPHRH